jgi:hypothetical protein
MLNWEIQCKTNKYFHKGNKNQTGASMISPSPYCIQGGEFSIDGCLFGYTCNIIHFGIIIVHEGPEFVDFMGHPYP